MNASLFYLVNEFLFLRRGTLDSFIIPSPVQFFIALPSVGDDDDEIEPISMINGQIDERKGLKNITL